MAEKLFIRRYSRKLIYIYIRELLFYQDVYIVFDRYRKLSVKSSTHTQRAKNLAYRYQLTLQTPLPDKEKVLSCSGNKVHLIDIICKYVSQKVATDNLTHLLVVTGSNDVPMQISNGVMSQKHEYRTTHEEADVIIVQQCYRLINNEGCNAVKIISDDTDVFSLACYFYPVERTDVTVFIKV